MAVIEEAPTTVGARTFFGQPRGLAYLAFTEAWERFSFYGMSSLLILYMTQQLFTPGHVENVVGLPAFRVGLEALTGPMTTLAFASMIGGLYAGLVYFTPVFGGLIADRWTGKRNAVAIGAVLMSAGHIAMAFDQSFLLALALLVIGSGFLKGNISAQVGTLYPPDDEAGRTRGFTIFSMAINVGALGGPILCGWLAQAYGWHVGFGVAGGLMLIGLATYLAGYSTLVDHGAGAKGEGIAAPPLTNADWKILAAIFAAMVIAVFQTIVYFQGVGIVLVWTDAATNLDIFGFRFPAPWLYSVDGLVCILAAPVLIGFWQWQSKNGGEPGTLGKFAIGALIACSAYIVLTAAAATWERPSVFFPILSTTILAVAFLYSWPPMLALVSQFAPGKIKSTMMGVVFFTLFFGGIGSGRMGALYEPMGPAMFFALNAGLAVVGFVLAIVLGPWIERTLRGK